jgi:hypothetical protein
LAPRAGHPCGFVMLIVDAKYGELPQLPLAQNA